MSVRKALVALAVTIMTTIGLVAVASPAQAAWADCPSGIACLWAGQNGTGTRYHITVGEFGVGNCISVGAPLNNNAESGRHTFGSNLRLRVYQDSQCSAVFVSMLYNTTTTGHLVIRSTTQLAHSR